MRIVVAVWLVASSGIAGAVSARGMERYQATQPHMGVGFSIVLYAPDEATANRGFAAAFRRIEDLNGVFSDYSSQSEAMRVCDAAPTEQSGAGQ